MDTKFGMSGAARDMARGRILVFSIDLLCRLYNTHALPCEYDDNNNNYIEKTAYSLSNVV